MSSGFVVGGFKERSQNEVITDSRLPHAAVTKVRKLCLSLECGADV